MTLASCKSDYARELELRMKFHNVVPPWEAAHTVGISTTGFYSWAFTQFHFALNVADPGESGALTTSPATYTGYAMATYNRGVNYWTLGGTGTATPSMKNTNAIVFPEKSNSGTQTMAAVSYAYIYASTDYSVARDTNNGAGLAVVISQFERPTLGALAFTVESL